MSGRWDLSQRTVCKTLIAIFAQAYLWTDLFTSLVDAHWGRILLFGAVLYVGQWFAFAFLYWTFNNESIMGCHTSRLVTFFDAFLLSIDSESTIGFGNYAVDSDCQPGIVVLVFQCLVSTLVNASFMGLIFMKVRTIPLPLSPLLLGPLLRVISAYGSFQALPM